MQVAVWEGYQIREAAVTTINPDDGPLAAVIGKTGQAHLALAAHTVDLADDSLVAPFGGTADHPPDHLVSWHAGEVHVTAGDLQVSRADPGQMNANQTLPVTRLGIGKVRIETERAIEDGGSHRSLFHPRLEKRCQDDLFFIASADPNGALSAEAPRRVLLFRKKNHPVTFFLNSHPAIYREVQAVTT